MVDPDETVSMGVVFERGLPRLASYPAALTFLSYLGVVYGVAVLLQLFLGPGTYPAAPLTWKMAVANAFEWIVPLLWLLFAMPKLAGMHWRTFAFPRLTGRDVRVAAACLVVMEISTYAVAFVQTHVFHVHGTYVGYGDMIRASSKTGPALAFALIGTLVSTVSEEITFRGIFFGAMLARYGPVAAALATSIVFAAYHHYWSGFIALFLDGLVLAFAFYKTRSLLVSYIVHAAYNGILFAAALLSAHGRG